MSETDPANESPSLSPEAETFPIGSTPEAKPETPSEDTAPNKEQSEESGIDAAHFVLAGIGPALYWEKVTRIAEGNEQTPSLFKRLLSDFVESHPRLQQVGEKTTLMRAKFNEDYPRLSGVLSSIRESSANSSAYSFKEIAERDVQAGRAFYMARPRHPVFIWALARNYDGSVNEERKKELYEQRTKGLAIRQGVGPISIRKAVLHPTKLYRPELEALNIATHGSLGARAVAFANIQRIANDKHATLTDRQWAQSIMGGKRLSTQESAKLREFMREYRTGGGSGPVATAA